MPKAAQKLPGWKIASSDGFQGLRQNVIDKLTAAEDVPMEIRAFVSATISKLPKQYSGAKVDIHGTTINDVATFAGTISPMTLAQTSSS